MENYMLFCYRVSGHDAMFILVKMVALVDRVTLGCKAGRATSIPYLLFIQFWFI
jgi:hypothetical protein